MVDEPVPPHGRGNAERNPEQDGQEARRRGQLDRRGHVLADVVQHRAVGRDRLAHVAPGQPGKKDHVLLVEGPVEAPARPEARDGLGIARLLVAELGQDRIGGNGVRDQENDQGGRRGHRGRGDHPEERTYRKPIRYTAGSCRPGASLPLPPSRPSRHVDSGHAYFAGFTSYRSTCHPAAVSW